MNEEVEEVNLVDAAYLYIMESKYPRGCKGSRKRAVRKKAHVRGSRWSYTVVASLLINSYVY